MYIYIYIYRLLHYVYYASLSLSIYICIYIYIYVVQISRYLHATMSKMVPDRWLLRGRWPGFRAASERMIAQPSARQTEATDTW